MLSKLYWSVWSTSALLALGFFMTGNFSQFTAVVFGFVSFGLVFMGMMSVLPSTVAHPAAPARQKETQMKSFEQPKVIIANTRVPAIVPTASTQRHTEAAIRF